MLRVNLVTVPVREAADSGDGLAAACDAFLAQGLVNDIEATGAELDGISRPSLDPDLLSDDRVANAGRYNGLVADAVRDGLQRGAQPLLAGGTCNHLVGMYSGLQQHYGADATIGLIWLDAHGDFNTPAISPSGMLGGMPVATVAGLCHSTLRRLAGQLAPLPTDRILMVDVRNLDPKEADLVETTDVTVARFDDSWNATEIQQAIAHLAEAVDHLYVHVDADILDASLQPNHPTVEPNGPNLEQTLSVVNAAMKTGKVRAYAVVSVNPNGEGGTISLEAGMGLLRGGLAAWASAS